MNEITWGEPPPNGADRRAKYAKLAEAARQRPGEWGYIAVSTVHAGSQLANSMKRGLARHWLPIGSFEAVSRQVDGKHRVYFRYVGADRKTEGES